MLQQFFIAMGFGLCHQLPERSFFGGGIQLPVCARDTGIYLGFVAAAVMILVLHKGQRPGRFPSPVGWVVVAALAGVMVLDGVTSYGGLRESNNLLRLITGAAMGYAVAAIVVPLLNSELWRRYDEEHVLTPAWRLAVWLLSLPALVVVAWFFGPALGVGYPIVATAAILVTFVSVNMAFAGLLPAYDRTAERAGDLWGPVAIGVVLTVVEFLGAAALRLGLEALVRSMT